MSDETESDEDVSARVRLRGGGGAVLRALSRGEKTVTEIVESTGLSQPNVSNHLARLRQQGAVTSRREGRQVVYSLGSHAVAQNVLGQLDRPRSVPPPDLDAIRRDFFDAVLTLKEELGSRVIERALVEGVPWRDLYLQVFVPTLEKVGNLWEAGELTVANEHLISGMVARLLHRISVNLPLAPNPQAPSALVTCAEGEYHTIGAQIAADFLLARGWRVWYLGQSLPVDDLVSAVNQHLPQVVIVCATTPDREEAVREAAIRLKAWRGGQPLPLLVGGGRLFDNPHPEFGFDIESADLDPSLSAIEARLAEIKALSA